MLIGFNIYCLTIDLMYLKGAISMRMIVYIHLMISKILKHLTTRITKICHKTPIHPHVTWYFYGETQDP